MTVSRTKSIFNSNIQYLQIVNHLLSIVGIVSVILGYASNVYILIGVFSYLMVEMVGTNIGMHRYFSHRSFATYRPIQYVFGFLATIATVGPIIGWVGLHRYHHGNTDTELDPHDPRRIGIINAWLYNWKRSKFSSSYIKLELSDSMIVFFSRHYFKTIFCYIALLTIINPWLVIWCYCIPACGSYLAISAVTVIGHLHGYKNYEIGDEARNSWITCLLSCGEGWHNNHHAQPGNYNNGHKWWEFDPNRWVIELLRIR